MRPFVQTHRSTQKTTLSAIAAGALLIASVASPPAPAAAAVADPAGLVNTLIGSSNHGETFPGATTPFGMVQFSPENTRGDQTRAAAPGGYRYDATRIR